jgi:hypothetical protein
MDPGFLSFDAKVLQLDFNSIIPLSVLAEAMDEALNEIETQVVANFEKNQGSWKPLAKSTQYQRLRQGYGGSSPILVRSGTLRDNAAVARSRVSSTNEIKGRVYPDEGAQTPYGNTSIGAYLQDLNSQRPFYELDDSQQKQVLDKFYAIIKNKLGLK